MRTSRGRMATRMAYEHFGIKSPKKNQQQLDIIDE
jgi:Holliday junction resolvasome RuvABC ATP-dependent DNA helicase subunit